MSRPRRTVALVALLCSLLGISGVAAAQLATAAPVLCDQYASTPIQSGRYIVMNNRWGTSATQCIDVTSSGFTVTQADGSVATNGAPKSYPAVYYGCHYGNCSTSNNILSPNGLQASDSRFAGISTSVSMSYPSSGTYDAAYDIWFNRSRPSTTTGQNDGAEVMVWLNRVGSIQPIGSKIGTANIAGATWDVWSGNIGWNVISYVRQQSTSSLSFSVSSFWNDVVSRGLGSNSWYLTSIQAGFEPWIGGTGLAVTNFSASVNGGGGNPGNPGTTTPPTTNPPGGTAGCRVTYSADSWGTGFVANVTVANTGSSALSDWTLGFTLPAGQSVTSSWNATLSGSSGALTARNTAHNGSIPAGGSTSFGFQGSYSGSFASPSAFTLNGSACTRA